MRMKRIRLPCIILTVCSITEMIVFTRQQNENEEASANVSRIRYQKPLIEQPPKDFTVRSSSENVDMAFLQKSLGFINCKTNQSKRANMFMEFYDKLKTDSRSVLLALRVPIEDIFADITKNDEKIKFCKDFVNDKLFLENGIKLQESPEEIQVVNRDVHYEYYTRETETVKAIRCPVLQNGYSYKLYVAGQQRISQSPNHIVVRLYFIMFERFPSKLDSPLSVLMYRHRQPYHFSLAEDNIRVLNIQNSRRRDRIEFSLGQNVWRNDLNLLVGRQAEQAFVTFKWDFITTDPDVSFRVKVGRFIQTVDREKLGYELDNETGSTPAIWNRKYDLRKRRLRDLNKYCSSVIETDKIGLHLTKTYDFKKANFSDVNEGVAELLTKTIHPFGRSRTEKFVHCPGKPDGISILPVLYKENSKAKCKRFHAFLLGPSKSDGELKLTFVKLNQSSMRDFENVLSKGDLNSASSSRTPQDFSLFLQQMLR